MTGTSNVQRNSGGAATSGAKTAALIGGTVLSGVSGSLFASATAGSIFQSELTQGIFYGAGAIFLFLAIVALGSQNLTNQAHIKRMKVLLSTCLVGIVFSFLWSLFSWRTGVGRWDWWVEPAVATVAAIVSGALVIGYAIWSSRQPQ